MGRTPAAAHMSESAKHGEWQHMVCDSEQHLYAAAAKNLWQWPQAQQQCCAATADAL
jgi:hypothetical protein